MQVHGDRIDWSWEGKMHGRDEFLATAKRVVDPVVVIYGAETPVKSRTEMEHLSRLPNVRAVILPIGKLGIHEEFPDAVATEVQTFLRPG